MFVTDNASTAKCQMAIAKKMSESSETGGDLGNSIRTLVDAEVEFEQDLTGLEEDDACRNASRIRGTPLRRSSAVNESLSRQEHAGITEPSVRLSGSIPGIEDLVADNIVADCELARDLEIQESFGSTKFLCDTSKAALGDVSLTLPVLFECPVWYRGYCVPHAIQLSVLAAFRRCKGLRSLIAGVRTTCRFFRKSGAAAEILATARKRAAKTALRVLLDCLTR
jgi:hypothetical protein